MENIAVPDLNIPRVVIIGGGFGGLHTVKALKNKDVQVVLIDRNNYHTFQPLLYQVATAGLEPDSIAFPIRKLFKGYKNFTFRNATVKRVIAEDKRIETNIGSLQYDFLIIATGSRTNFFGMEDVKNNAMPLKTVIQSLDFRHLMLQNFEKALLTSDISKRESQMNFVLVGAGPTGVEMAGALGELKRFILPTDYPELDVRRMQIHIIEAGPRLLPALDKASSDKAYEYLKKLGVNIWLNTAVKSYDGTEVLAQDAAEGKEVQILAKNLIWSAGVEGNHFNGIPENKIARGNRIEVDEFNAVKDLEGVYAIGDVAAMINDDTPRGHPMVAPVAIQQGELLAKNLMRKIAGQPMKSFKYHDKGSMATIGKNKAVVEVGKFKSQGAFAWFIWMFVHIMSLVGYRNKVIVLINWLWNYVNYDRGIRLIIRPFSIGLRNERRKEEEEETVVI